MLEAEWGPVRRGLAAVAPVGVNLLLGIPAIVPLLCGWWLWTRYLPMDCRHISDFTEGRATECNLHTLDHAGVVMVLGAVSAVAVALPVLFVDVLSPRRRGSRRRPLWAASAALVPVPFAVLWALARTQG